MEYVAWRNVYNKSNIIFIQPGHDKRTFAESSYKQLLKQAIVYLAGTNQTE
jgi:type 1 glutamine amidotransferase